MSTVVFLLFLGMQVARSYYMVWEQALMATQEFRALGLNVSISFVVFLIVAFVAHAVDSFAVLYSAELLFMASRAIGAKLLTLRLARLFPGARYSRGTITDPEYALQLTITDP